VSRTILVVEDNVDAAESMRMLLEMDGHRVEIAHDGPTALEVARQSHPEVVFCDIGLPNGMDGYQFAENFRHDPTMQPAELVAVSGYGAEEDKRRAARAGFDLHLTKPVAPAEMTRILEVGSRP
jgi:CheY-like chemotaxis protein